MTCDEFRKDYEWYLQQKEQGVESGGLVLFDMVEHVRSCRECRTFMIEKDVDTFLEMMFGA